MHPQKIVSREEWLAARKTHLAHEKQLTAAREKLAAERRALPWVRIDKAYAFDGPDGRVSRDKAGARDETHRPTIPGAMMEAMEPVRSAPADDAIPAVFDWLRTWFDEGMRVLEIFSVKVPDASRHRRANESCVDKCGDLIEYSMLLDHVVRLVQRTREHKLPMDRNALAF